MILTHRGQERAKRVLAEVVLSLTPAEEARIEPAKRGPTLLELARVLRAWERFQDEQQPEKWFRAACLQVLAAMGESEGKRWR